MSSVRECQPLYHCLVPIQEHCLSVDNAAHTTLTWERTLCRLGNPLFLWSGFLMPCTSLVTKLFQMRAMIRDYVSNLWQMSNIWMSSWLLNTLCCHFHIWRRTWLTAAANTGGLWYTISNWYPRTKFFYKVSFNLEVKLSLSVYVHMSY
jgi:hypothetical protein